MHRGVLRRYDPPNPPYYYTKSELATLDPTQVHEVYSAFYTSIEDETRHPQIADRAFEDKSRLTLANYLATGGQEFEELPRVWFHKRDKPESKPAIEWEGVFKVGNMYLVLECKHHMTTVPTIYVLLTSIQTDVGDQESRREKMAGLLGTSKENVQIFLAGKYWDKGVRKFADVALYGVLFENGNDLSVIAPRK